MEHDAHYVSVGAFAVLVIAMAIGFVFWYSDANDRREYAPYEIYFSGSVAGLNQGGPVRYLGVDVGRVRRLSIDRKRPDSVQVIVEIDSAAPISGATRASLALQGVTGLLFVNLKQADGGDNGSKLPQGERYPMIQSVPSDFDVFLSSLPELMGRATALVDRVNQVFSPQNVEAVTETLASLRATTRGLPQTAQSVQQLVQEMRGTVNEINGIATSMRGLADESRPQVRTMLERLGTVADNLSRSSVRLDQMLAGSESQVKRASNQGLFELERLLRDSRAAAQEFRDLSRSLKENPSQLLYEVPDSGMEIAR